MKIDRQKLILIIVSFILGYVFASLIILAGKGITPYSLKDILNNNPRERKFMFIHSLNPFEPMNPGWYFLFYPKQK